MKLVLLSLTLLLLLSPVTAQKTQSLEGLSTREIKNLILNQEENPDAASLMRIYQSRKTVASVIMLSGALMATTAILSANPDPKPGSLEGLETAFWTFSGVTITLIGVAVDATANKKYKQAKSLYIGNISEAERDKLVSIASYGFSSNNKQLREFLLTQDRSEEARTLATEHKKLKFISDLLFFGSASGFIASIDVESKQLLQIGSGIAFVSSIILNRRSKKLLIEAERIYLGEDLQSLSKKVFIRDDRIELPSYTIIR